MKRRLLALALASLVLDPLAPLAGLRAAGPACRDHVCLCARRCPPQRSPAPPCHKSASEAATVRATCSHDEAAGLASVAPAMLPAEVPLAIAPAVVLAGPAVSEDPAPGFQTIVPPPPKSA